MRVVVKVGTSSLTSERGVIDTTMIASLCDQIGGLRRMGHDVLLVSSGAVSAGVAALGLRSRPSDMITLQALSAAGQPRLMEHWNREFERNGLISAQALVVPNDFMDRRQYLHARSTLQRLVELGCVPVINENDAIAADEIRYGDNDRIAALLSHLVKADALVLLTDTDGLYTADPRTDPAAALLSVVAADDPLLSVRAGESGSNRGSGGMASKLTAARIASWSGVRTVIARAKAPGVLAAAVGDDRSVGTTFLGHDRRLSARKLWLAFAAAPSGALVVDEGARRALVERNTSLLPAGVTAVRGTFDEGDAVEITDSAGHAVARGAVSVDSATARTMLGRRTTDLPTDVAHELVHRDHLVLL